MVQGCSRNTESLNAFCNGVVGHEQRSGSVIRHGFSLRLNHILNHIAFVPMNQGRRLELAELLEVSEATAGRWLNTDKPPTPIQLNRLCAGFAASLSVKDGVAASIEQIQIWLLYGERTEDSTLPFA
mgnify:CR=1 FL=1